MKNLVCLLMALTIGLVMASCNKQGDLANQQEFLLKAPSGVAIATTSDDLLKVAQETVASSSSLEITKVDYLPVKTGFAAIVWYKTKAGAAGNFAYVRYPKVEYNAKKLVVKRGGVTSQLVKGDITVSCNGTCGCVVSGEIKPDGTITFKCGCTDCTATIKTGQN
ncbi:MAG: hypothetical protein ACKOWL_04710 [Sphingobacteriaceae bacterium]